VLKEEQEGGIPWIDFYKQKNNTSKTDQIIEDLLFTLRTEPVSNTLFQKKARCVIRDKSLLVLESLVVVRLHHTKDNDPRDVYDSSYYEQFKRLFQICELSQYIAIAFTDSHLPLHKGLENRFMNDEVASGDSWMDSKKPEIIEDLEGLPCVLFIKQKGRMGDTFPENFKYYDLRSATNSHPMLSTVKQELGRLCTYMNPDSTSLPRKALISQKLKEYLVSETLKELSIDRYLVEKTTWAKRVEEFTTTPNLNSYDENNTEKDDRRLVLKAEPQIGKTGTYLQLLHYLRAEYGAPYVPLDTHDVEEWARDPVKEELVRQQFLDYSSVAWCKYTLPVQWERLELLCQAVEQHSDETCWKKHFIDLVTTREAILSKRGRKKLKLRVRNQEDDLPLKIIGSNITLEHRDSVRQLVAWDGRGTPHNIIKSSTISLDREDVKRRGIDFWPNSMTDDPEQGVNIEYLGYHAKRTYKETQPNAVTEYIFPVEKIENLKFTSSCVRFFIPPNRLEYFTRDQDSPSIITGVTTQAATLDWFFIPTCRTPGMTFLNWEKALRGHEVVQVVVVKESDLEKWKNSQFIIMVCPNQVAIKPNKKLYKFYSATSGCGFSRLVIQRVSYLLNLNNGWSWQIDDNFDVFMELKSTDVPPTDIYMSSVLMKVREWRENSNKTWSGNPNEDIAVIGFYRQNSNWDKIDRPFSNTHRIYSLYCVNNRLTIRNNIFWPPKGIAEDIEFHHMCNEKQLLTLRCNFFIFQKNYLTSYRHQELPPPVVYKWDEDTVLHGLVVEKDEEFPVQKTHKDWVCKQLGGQFHVTQRGKTSYPTTVVNFENTELAKTNQCLVIFDEQSEEQNDFEQYLVNFMNINPIFPNIYSCLERQSW
jgi:hypothetical protein